MVKKIFLQKKMKQNLISQNKLTKNQTLVLKVLAKANTPSKRVFPS